VAGPAGGGDGSRPGRGRCPVRPVAVAADRAWLLASAASNVFGPERPCHRGPGSRVRGDVAQEVTAMAGYPAAASVAAGQVTPWGVLADVNALAGAQYLHWPTELVAPSQGGEVSSVAYALGGTTTTYMVPTPPLPLLMPLQQIGATRFARLRRACDRPCWVGGDPLRPAAPRLRSPVLGRGRPASPGCAALAIAPSGRGRAAGPARCGPARWGRRGGAPRPRRGTSWPATRRRDARSARRAAGTCRVRP